MIWDVEYGTHIPFFEQLQEMGKETPLDLIQDLDECDLWYKETYLSLAKSQQSEFGSNLISLEEMIFHFEYFSTPLPFDISSFILKRIDLNILDYREKKRKSNQVSKSKAK